MIGLIKYSKKKINLHKLFDQKLKKHDVVVVKNFLNHKSKISIFNFLKKTFKSRKDIRRSGEFTYFQKDYKRLDIGDSYINQRVSRFLLYTEWNKNNSSLYKNINEIINLRNKIIGTNKTNYEYKFGGYNSKKYKFCDMIRMIQYPTGGGFLSSHNDKEYLYPKQMINVLMPFSKRIYGRGNIDISKSISPLKMFDYMASGKIIIASELKIYEHILKNKHNSILIKSNNPIKWKENIEKIFKNPKKYKNISINAYHNVKKYTWDARVKKIKKKFLFN